MNINAIFTLHDPGKNLRPDSKLRPAALDSDEMIGFYYARFNGFCVERPDGAHVDHLQKKTQPVQTLSCYSISIHKLILNVSNFLSKCKCLTKITHKNH